MLRAGERRPPPVGYAFDRYERRWDLAIQRLTGPYMGPLPDDDPMDRPMRLAQLGGLTMGFSALRGFARQDAERAAIILEAHAHDPEVMRRALGGHFGPAVDVALDKP